MSPPPRDDARPLPRILGRFRGLGPLSARMAIIQHSPLHVNGAYREKEDTVAKIKV